MCSSLDRLAYESRDAHSHLASDVDRSRSGQRLQHDEHCEATTSQAARPAARRGARPPVRAVPSFASLGVVCYRHVTSFMTVRTNVSLIAKALVIQ